MAASRHGFSANLAMLFKESKCLLHRFTLARAAGFDAVEISTPELFNYSPGEIASALRSEDLSCVLFNMPAGSWTDGERGLAALPGRQREFQHAIDTTQLFAEALECRRVHCLAGIAPVDEQTETLYRANLGHAASELGSIGVDMLIEPINQRSIPGYHLRCFEQASRTIEAVRLATGSTSIQLLFDVFHCQILHGDLAARLRQHRSLIGHVQIAGVPDRGEPDDQQEVNYPYIFRLLRGELEYRGHIGCEYVPRSGTVAGLRPQPSK